MATELRRDRREKQKRQRQRQQQRRRSSGGISSQIVVALFVLGAIALAILGARAAGVFEPAAAAFDLNSSEFQVPSGTTIGTQEPLLAPEHIPVGQRATYNTVPPTSGQHWSSSSPAAPAPWGIKDSTLENEVTTHNLEHGGIVIGYNNLTPTEVTQLKSIVRTLMNGTYRKMIRAVPRVDRLKDRAHVVGLATKARERRSDPDRAVHARALFRSKLRAGVERPVVRVACQ